MILWHTMFVTKAAKHGQYDVHNRTYHGHKSKIINQILCFRSFIKFVSIFTFETRLNSQDNDIIRY